jgi:phage terminase small subunit
MKPLTEKERRFVEAYVGPAKGNGTEAASQSGNGKTRRSQAVIAATLLTKLNIQDAIRKAQERRATKAAITNERIDELLAEIAEKKAADVHARIGAMKELNKTRGRHSSTVHFKGRLTVEQALEDSYDPR